LTKVTTLGEKALLLLISISQFI